MRLQRYTPSAAPSAELIWLASKSKEYYFDYELAREMNGGNRCEIFGQYPRVGM